MVEAADVKIGEWIVWNRQPYKLKRREIVTAGTHMHSKLKFIMSGLFSSGEKTAVFSHHDKVDLADISLSSGQVLSVSGNSCQLMDTKSYETLSAELLIDDVKEGDTVQYALYDGRGIVFSVIK